MEITFKTIYPRAKLSLFIMLMIEGCLCVDLLIGKSNSFTYLNGFMMFIILAYIIAIIKRQFFTKLSITFGIDYVISSRNKKYDSSRIECIYMSYRRLGFKVKGKRLVPMELYFYFDRGQEIKGLEVLREWAEHNKKEVKNRFFQTLM